MPRALQLGAIVPHLDGLVFTGGHTGKGNVDTMYWYNPETGQWSLLPERLAGGAHAHVAFPVARRAFIDN